MKNNTKNLKHRFNKVHWLSFRELLKETFTLVIGAVVFALLLGAINWALQKGLVQLLNL